MNELLSERFCSQCSDYYADCHLRHTEGEACYLKTLWTDKVLKRRW